VIASSALMAMARFFVSASGVNRRPSCASSVNTGMNATAITSREAKIAGPTSLAESISTWLRSPLWPSRSHSAKRLWALSTMMMAASTMSPMATMIPPIDMMFMPTPRKYIGMKAIRIASGSVMIGITADRTCSRKADDEHTDDNQLLDEILAGRLAPNH
jgi:hypothetical protein